MNALDNGTNDWMNEWMNEWKNENNEVHERTKWMNVQLN